MLAGRIPPDIAEILTNRETIKHLRAERAKKEAKNMNHKSVPLPKIHIPFKSLYRLALPVFLVILVAVSIWYAAPTPVKALEISYSSLPAGTLGSTYTFTVTVSIQSTEHLPVQSADVIIYKVDAPTTYKATLANMPLVNTSTTAHNPSEGSGSGTATIAAAADAAWGYTASATGYANWKGTGYSFSPSPSGGYGYQAGTGTTSIVYTIVWTPPSSWPAGSYKIDTRLTTGTQNPGGGTTFTETSTAFTLSAIPAAEVPSGGGGGVATTGTGTTYVYDVVTTSGQFTQAVTAKSGDQKVAIDIARGVIGKTSAGASLTRLTITPMATPPAPPAEKNIIGLTYDLGPQGATFNPPITVTFTYNPADIPAGVDEKNLTIAYYDTAKGAWVVLEGITVNTTTHTISGKTSHFTAFTVLSPSKPAPAPTTPVPTTPKPTTPVPTTPAPTTPKPTTPAPTTPAPTTPAPTTPKPTTPAATPVLPVTTPPVPGLNWWLIGGIIIVVIIVAVVVGRLVVSRRR
jgi:hypothetical protein